MPLHLPREFRGHHKERLPDERRVKRPAHRGGGGRRGGQERHADPKRELYRMSEKALKDLRALLQRAKQHVRRVRLSERQRAIIKEIIEREGWAYDNFMETRMDNFILSNIQSKKDPSRRLEYLEPFYKASLVAGLELLRQNKPFEASRIFLGIISDYFGGTVFREGFREPIVTDKIGRQAVRYARIVSRAHAIGSALEYMVIDNYMGYTDAKKAERAEVRRAFSLFESRVEDKLADLHSELLALGFAGDISDILVIRQISQFCGDSALEGHCSHAITHILIRDGLLKVIDSAKGDLQAYGIDTRGLSRRMLAERIYPLIYKLGLGDLMRVTGGASGVKSRGWDYLAELRTKKILEELHKKGPEKLLSEAQLEFSFQEDFPEESSTIDYSRQFLEKSGIIRKIKGGKSWSIYVLTKKGIEFVKFLIRLGKQPRNGKTQALPK